MWIITEWIITLCNHYFVVICSFSALTSTFERKQALKVFPRSCCLRHFLTQTEPMDRTYSAGDIQPLAGNLAMVWSDREKWEGNTTSAVCLWDNGERKQRTAAADQPIHIGQEEKHQPFQHEVTGNIQLVLLCTCFVSCTIGTVFVNNYYLSLWLCFWNCVTNLMVCR